MCTYTSASLWAIINNVGFSRKFAAPTATILGGPDFYVQKGSTINLTCTIRLAPDESPAFIFWYHEDEVKNEDFFSNFSHFFMIFSLLQVINYDSRGGISIETRKGDLTTSHLLIQNADETNSGKYSCSPSNAIVSSIRVHVLNGNKKIFLICVCEQYFCCWMYSRER